MKRIALRIYSLLPSTIQKYWKRVEDSDIGSRIAKGAFWSLFGQIISKGILLLSTLILARILGKLQYGEFGIIRSTVIMFSVFASFGMGITATKYISQYRNTNPKLVGRIIGLSNLFVLFLGLILTSIVIIFAQDISNYQLHAPHLTIEIRLGALILFFSALNGAQSGILAGFEKFKLIAKSNLYAGIAYFPFQIAFAYSWGLPGAVVGFGLFFLFISLISEIMIIKTCNAEKIKIDYKNAYKELKIITSFSLPLLIINLLITVSMWWCSTFLVKQNRGFEEMALFDVANQWRMTLLFIPTALSQMILPIISSVTDLKKTSQIMRINVRINFTIALTGALVLSFLSTYILKAYGNSFSDGNLVFITLIISSILIAVTNVYSQHILSKGNIYKTLLINIFFSISLLVSSYILIPKYFALGLAYSFNIAYAINLILQVLYSKLISSTLADF